MELTLLAFVLNEILNEGKMNLFKLISILAILLNSIWSKGQVSAPNPQLQLIATIELPNVSGRIDHLAFDSDRQILYVAALGNNTVEVVDLKSRRVIHTIQNLDEPQGLAYIPVNHMLVVANGGNGECNVYNTIDYQKTASVQLGSDADNVRYDAKGNKIYVGYGNGSLAIIDVNGWKKIADIRLTGHPESFQIDKTSNKIYVNVPDTHQVEVIDLTKQTVSERWKITEASSNFPMSLDEKGHRLMIGCRHPSRLLILDTKTGKTISSVESDSDTDDIFFNQSDQLIYMSCGSGHVDLFKQIGTNQYERQLKLESRTGARTSLFLATLDQLAVAAPSRLGSNAQIMIYKYVSVN